MSNYSSTPAESHAIEARRDFEVSADSAVDVELFCAEKLDVDVCSVEAIGFIGNLIVDNGAARILVSNRVRNKAWRQFTVAHELGHYFMHAHQIPVMGTLDNEETVNDWGKQKHEIEANDFAACFLLPRPLIKIATRGQELNWSRMRTIAYECNASLRATAKRCVDLSGDNIAMVVTRDGLKRWFARSRSFEGFLLDGALPIKPERKKSDDMEWNEHIAGNWLHPSDNVHTNAKILVSSFGPDALGEDLTLLWDESGAVFHDDDDDEGEERD